MSFKQTRSETGAALSDHIHVDNDISIESNNTDSNIVQDRHTQFMCHFIQSLGELAHELSLPILNNVTVSIVRLNNDIIVFI